MKEFIESLLSQGFPATMAFFHAQNTIKILLISGIFYGLLHFQIYEALKAKKLQTKTPSIYQKKLERKYFWQTILIMPFISFPLIYLMYQYGLYEVNYNFNWLLLFGQFAILMIASDTYFYWCHRVMHHRSFYGKIHAVHHASVTPEAISAYNFDIWETFVNFSFLLWYVIAIVLTTGSLHYLPIVLYIIIFHTWNLYIHSGIEYAPQWLRRSWFGRQITWATHHDLHHEKNRGNFALYFTFWDRVGGTLDPEYRERVTG